MLEKDIENLIARYPDEFFQGAGLRLKGQQVKIGSCYADIIFTDKYGRTIVVEVKKGILSRDGAGQIIEYYGLLKQQSIDKIIELVLCANVIPHERRIFLENTGIECKELGLSLIQNIAKKYGYEFLDKIEHIQTTKVSQKEKYISDRGKVTLSQSENVWIFQANPNRYDIFNALSEPELLDRQTWLVKRYKGQVLFSL